MSEMMFECMGDTGLVVEAIIALQAVHEPATLGAIAKVARISSMRVSRALRVVKRTGVVYHARTNDLNVWAIRHDATGDALIHAVRSYHATMALARLAERRLAS